MRHDRSANRDGVKDPRHVVLKAKRPYHGAAYTRPHAVRAESIEQPSDYIVVSIFRSRTAGLHIQHYGTGSFRTSGDGRRAPHGAPQLVTRKYGDDVEASAARVEHEHKLRCARKSLAGDARLACAVRVDLFGGGRTGCFERREPRPGVHELRRCLRTQSTSPHHRARKSRRCTIVFSEDSRFDRRAVVPDSMPEREGDAGTTFASCPTCVPPVSGQLVLYARKEQRRAAFGLGWLPPRPELLFACSSDSRINTYGGAPTRGHLLSGPATRLTLMPA